MEDNIDALDDNETTRDEIPFGENVFYYDYSNYIHTTLEKWFKKATKHNGLCSVVEPTNSITSTSIGIPSAYNVTEIGSTRVV